MNKLINHFGRHILFYISSLYLLLVFFAESSPVSKSVLLIVYLFIISAKLITENQVRSYPALLILFIIFVGLIIYLIETIDFAIRVVAPICGFFMLAILVLKIISRKLEPPFLATILKLMFLLLYSIFTSTITIFLLKTYVYTYPTYWITKILRHLNIDTFFITCLGLVFTWFVLEFLIMVVRNEDRIETFGTIVMLRVILKVFLALIFTDVFFGFAYVSFVPTESIGLKNSSNIMDAFTFENFTIYMKGLYFAFCTHFSLDLPETDFYSGMQDTITNYQYMKIVLFCHITISKVIEITVLAHIASIFLRIITNSTNSTNSRQ